LKEVKNKMSVLYFFKVGRSLALVLLVILLPFQAAASNADYINVQQSDNDFPLVSLKGAATLYVDKNDHKGVRHAVSNLQTDIGKVTGIQPDISHKNSADKTLVIIGTLGQSTLIDQLVATKKLEVTSLKGQWEAYRIQVLNNPLPNVKQALVIVGSDKRGTTFGVYDLSEKIGVSPWYWWADVPIKRSAQLFIKQDTYYQDQPKVKYRGIFLNDEAPALTNWVKAKYGDYNHKFYLHVFDLLLRLKANFLWPAMWNSAFSDDDRLNMVLADEYGIVMSNSHHEPMLCADKEWNRRGEGKWDYDVNAKNLYQFWQKCAARNKPYESIYTLGMRGQHDTPMSENENIGLLERIVKDQREILTQTFDEKDISEVPQVWTLYKEVQGYYENGMRVPDDVTLLWSDDNWGNIRRLPTPEERKRSGGAGVYYHFDYVGGPRSYRWINTTPITKIWEQMDLAYQFDAKQIWLTNVGDLKPMEYPIDFFLTMAWNPEAMPKEKLHDYNIAWVTQQFGTKYSQEIVDILTGYTRHNGRRKPELMDENTYSQLNYNEADTVSAELQALVIQAQAIYKALPENKQPAFFQLVLHPIKASTTLFELYNNVAKNRLYAAQGRASANDYAELAKQNFANDAQLKEQYHQLKDGRWQHFMDQSHIGYSNWNNPPQDVLPWLSINSPAKVADMGVAIEGHSTPWPQTGRLSLDSFSPYGQQQRYIDVFNKGLKAFNFTATASDTWINISQSSGKVTKGIRLLVSVDWSKAPKGTSIGSIFIKGTGWGGAKIKVSAVNPKQNTVKGFIEADGYISMEAASAKTKSSGTTSSNQPQASWQEIPSHGRTHSSMAATTSNIDHSFEDPKKAPYLEYDVHLFSQGRIEVQTIVSPTLAIVPTRGLRFAIGFDDEEPQIIDILKNSKHSDWQESVKNGVRYAISHHNISQAGAHKLRIYMVDVGVVIQKVVINTGGLKPSYLGPKQSQFIK